jgi:four helix bundle protein
MWSAGWDRMANRLEDLPIYSKARAFTVAVDAILRVPRVRSDRDLWGQLNDANDSILSNMREGFEQSTDDAFAKYLNYAKGSAAEVVGWLKRAEEKHYISADQYSGPVEMGAALGRMLGGFIKYLRRSGFKDRGHFKK